MTNGPGSAPQQGWGGRIRDLFTSGVSFSNRAVGRAQQQELHRRRAPGRHPHRDPSGRLSVDPVRAQRRL
ncbi:hypothetical protein LP420_35400 [Massilia sp. B-10]|nr:hypothetical protein LP420_35400 [Massilia sp. B-10]